MSRTGGIPLLSGRPPPHSGPSQSACRKCGREFSILFNRRRECTHCGYDYCSSCTDYQALVPRRGPTQGYSLAPVCAYCIEMLNITALGRAQLRSLPLAKLRRYIESYNILVKNPVDKNDLVDAAIAARTPQGCLSPVNENFYRKYSVPSSYTPGSSSSSANRNSSPRGSPNTNPNSSSRSNPNRSFPRPDLGPNHQQRMTPPTGGQPDIPRPTSSSGRQSAPSSSSTAHVSSPLPFPPPPMSTLVTLPRSYLSGLSVSALKQILFEARVRVPPGVVEKEELVGRVWALVEEEKRKDDEGLDDVGLDTREDEMEDMDPKSKPRSHPQPTTAERSGLCVVCQDEEACIAIVDCGHLAMCRACSDLVLASSRECPLCRTRIVTEARLLRIFKT
ncbi:hypothetical protein HD554DRAFT_2019561 [Boletus coccyginus]|nr:hypothetical protein HD554DRAFT_2019561 [Boletus coccyginus]